MTTQSDTHLHRLIYISSATNRSGLVELDQILALSRTNNAARGLTGMLLFHDGCFFQVLEGDAGTIARTFATISRDARRGGVIILGSRAITERGFPHWSMGYVGAQARHPTQREWLVDLSARVASDDPTPLLYEARVNVHIDTFLGSFRESS